jgi:hypothetical protein
VTIKYAPCPIPLTKAGSDLLGLFDQDEELRNKLESHLAALKRAKRVDVWHDRKIPAGAHWRDAIHRELDARI